MCVVAAPPPLAPPMLAAPAAATCGVSLPSSVTIWHRSHDGEVVIQRELRPGCRRFDHAEDGRSCLEWCSSICVAAWPSPAVGPYSPPCHPSSNVEEGKISSFSMLCNPESMNALVPLCPNNDVSSRKYDWRFFPREESHSEKANRSVLATPARLPFRRCKTTSATYRHHQNNASNLLPVPTTRGPLLLSD